MAFVVKQINQKVKVVSNPTYSLYVGKDAVAHFTEDDFLHNQKEVDAYIENSNLEVELNTVDGYCYLQVSGEKEDHYLLSAEDDSFQVHVSNDDLKQLFKL